MALFGISGLYRVEKKHLRDIHPGSRIFFHIPDPGVKQTPDPGSGSTALLVVYRYFIIYER
jgi:hypothetical protein